VPSTSTFPRSWALTATGTPATSAGHGASGLFEEWRVAEAGGVFWSYQGRGGAYGYWPDGLDGPMRSEYPPFANSALVGDNNRMYHRIGWIGDPAATPPVLSAAAQISRHAGRHFGRPGLAAGTEAVTSGPFGLPSMLARPVSPDVRSG
jgi:hypothetical protein